MTRRAGSAILLLSFALVPWVLEACGRGANVLEGDFGEGGAPFDGSFAGEPTGGLGGGGAGGSKTVGGSGPRLGAGGIIGPGGSPAMGGAPTAGGGPATGGSVNAEIRRVLVEELCALPTKFPCLSLEVKGAPASATVEQKQELCRQASVRSLEALVEDRCFNEWYDNAVCAVQYTDYCPCDPDAGQACAFAPETHDYGPACAAPAAKLFACAGSQPSGTELGPAGAYDWVDDEQGCTVTGIAKNGIDRIGSVCSGPTGGAQLCSCSVNGVILDDTILGPTGGELNFFVENCKAVAVELAGGRCAGILDCCYDFIEDGHAQDCVCASDPRAAGYPGCAALAEAQKAVVVDHCDIYRPPTRP